MSYKLPGSLNKCSTADCRQIGLVYIRGKNGKYGWHCKVCEAAMEASARFGRGPGFVLKGSWPGKDLMRGKDEQDSSKGTDN